MRTETMGMKQLEATAYQILLSPGGPAIRITGALNTFKTPEPAQLEYQEWLTPWTQYISPYGDQEDTLLIFAREFFFGLQHKIHQGRVKLNRSLVSSSKTKGEMTMEQNTSTVASFTTILEKQQDGSTLFLHLDTLGTMTALGITRHPENTQDVEPIARFKSLKDLADRLKGGK